MRPLSRSALLTHSSNVCAEQPILPAIDEIAAQRDGCSPSWSSTIRTARSRTSGENLFVVWLVMAPSYLGVEASRKPGAVQGRLRRTRGMRCNGPGRRSAVLMLA